MKVLLIPFISLLLLSSARNPEETHFIKVEYAMVVKPTAQINQLSPELRNALLDPMHYILENTGKESLYYVIKTPDKHDSTKTTRSEGNQTEHHTIVTRITARTPPPVIYKNFENNILLTGREIQKKAYLTQADFTESNWKIQKETAVIAGMECKRATRTMEATGIELEAWFTPEIPLHDGPAGYYGLPGLILKVESPNNTIYATRITYPKELKIQKPTGELITREELNKIQEKDRAANRQEPGTTEEREGNTYRRTTRGETIKLN